jgi:hypothetical protein
MQKIIYFILTLTVPVFLHAQEREVKTSKYVNQTEIAMLMGRTLETVNTYYPYYLSSSSYYSCIGCGNRTTTKKSNTGSFSIQTFNGWRVKPKTSVGITTGLDAYQGALIMPVAAGIRQIVFDKGPTQSKIQASLDAGIGTTWLNEDDGQETEGGLMLNPAVGFVFPTRSGSAFLFNFGYKYQHYSVKKTWAENNFSEESRNIKRVQIRLGFQF